MGMIHAMDKTVSPPPPPTIKHHSSVFKFIAKIAFCIYYYSQFYKQNCGLPLVQSFLYFLKLIILSRLNDSFFQQDCKSSFVQFVFSVVK